MKRDPHPDLELAQRAAAGNQTAWREIYTSTREKLFSLLVYHLGNREEALDVLQDVYVGAVQGIERYRGDASLEAWLVGIALLPWPFLLIWLPPLLLSWLSRRTG